MRHLLFPEYQLVLAGAPVFPPSITNVYVGGVDVKIIFNKTFPFVEAGRGCTGHFGDGNAGNSSCFRAASGMLPYSDREGYRFLKRHILKVKYISLVNLIANREVVKELVADTMTVEQARFELNRIFVMIRSIANRCSRDMSIWHPVWEAGQPPKNVLHLHSGGSTKGGGKNNRKIKIC